MSATTFVEANSADPYVRDLHRKAMRVLNDPSLDRQQREFHVRRLQAALLEHQALEAAKAARLAEKKGKREQVSSADRNKGVADQSQVQARRREFARSHQASEEQERREPENAAKPVAKSGDSFLTGRKRPVLTLRRV